MPAAAPTKTKYEAIIGLETHCQLCTETKIFSPASTAFGADPNTPRRSDCAGNAGGAARAESKGAGICRQSRFGAELPDCPLLEV